MHFLATYRIGSYEAWRRLALTRTLPKELDEQRVFGTRWWYPVVRLWYPIARTWWRTSAAVRARISPPIIPDAVVATGSHRAPTRMAGTITAAGT